MTRKKYKPTGCARFILVILILIPAAYFGAKAIRGGEGIPVIDDFIESIFSKSDDGQTATPHQPVDMRDSDGEKKDKLIRELHDQVNDLKEENEALNKEIERMKQNNSQ